MQDAPKFHELMPPGYIATLAESTGLTDPSGISKLVRYPNPRSKYWPAAVALAEKNDPEGFARWAAAHPDKLPKVAA